MTVKRADSEGVEGPRRLTPTQREHELAMAYATKTPRTTTPATESGTYTTGTQQGNLYIKSHVTVRDEAEDWPQYIGRVEQELRDLNAAIGRLNAERIVIPEPAE